MTHPPPKKFEILLVEDNWGDALLMREAFRESGLVVKLSIVTDGEQALAFLNREGIFAEASRPDLILLDLNLPRMDGRGFLRRIKTHPAFQDLQVVVLTTSKLDSDIREVSERDIRGYIVKPVDLDGFLKVTRSLGDFLMKSTDLPRPNLD